MNDFMIDIEALGKKNRGAITQIGACFFNRCTGEIGEKFLINIRIQDCLDKGLQVDGETLKWWFEQTNRSWLENPVDLGKALQELRNFYYLNKKAQVWSHATFDIPMLENAYNTIGQRLPFSYRQLRDIRTLVDLSGLHTKKEKRDPKTHNGLDDCIYQVEYCCRCFKELEK